MKILSERVFDQPDAVRRFYKEGRMLGEIKSPYVTKLLEINEDDGLLYIAMEYVPGIDLEHVLIRQLEKGILMPAELAIYVVREVLQALEYAHEHLDEDGKVEPVIHRDISPPNVLISRRGNIKIADFGIWVRVNSM